MIEKKMMVQKMKEHVIKEFISKELPRSCYSNLELRKTPLGEKILIYTSRPGLVVGGKGANVQRLTEMLKHKFQMENPQIEVVEIDNPSLDPLSVAEKIVSAFERFGPKRFKSLGYSALQDIMNAKALGAEIVISGRGVPSSRSRRWRFLTGHLKKSGDISESHVKRAQAVAHLKSGSVGVQVSILTADVRLPDDIRLKPQEVETEIQPKTESEEISQQAAVKKKASRKSTRSVQAQPITEPMTENTRIEEIQQESLAVAEVQEDGGQHEAGPS